MTRERFFAERDDIAKLAQLAGERAGSVSGDLGQVATANAVLLLAQVVFEALEEIQADEPTAEVPS